MTHVNPIRRVFRNQKPFIIFHTHVIDRKILDAAVAARKSLEVDLSIDEKGEIYVGHPLSHYKSLNLPPPNNLSLEVILREAKAAGLFLVLDCKDTRVLPKAREIIEDYGAEHCLLHSWSDALVLDPYLEKVSKVQPNWKGEELDHSEILKLRRATNVPMTLSCHRGLTRKILQAKGDVIAARIAEILDGNAEGLSFALPDDEDPPLPAMEALLARRILPHIHVDAVSPEARPPIYLGWTNHLEAASDPQDFR